MVFSHDKSERSAEVHLRSGVQLWQLVWMMSLDSSQWAKVCNQYKSQWWEGVVLTNDQQQSEIIWLNQSGMSISWKAWIFFFPVNWKRSKRFLARLQWVRWVTTELVAGHFSTSRSMLNYWRYTADAWFKLTGFHLADAVSRSCITLLKPIWLLFALTMDYSQWI